MNAKQFVNALADLGITITDVQLQQLEKYYDLLVFENKKYNLTAITNKEEVYLKHFYDSLTLATVMTFKQQTICDIGSGAGFPGIVLKIVFPELQVTLIDATTKKVAFQKKVISELNLKNIEALHQRVEEHHQKYDITVARAVSKLNVLLELCIPITKEKGYFIAMKANANKEIDEAQNALIILNCKIEIVKEVLLPNEDLKRNLIKIVKNEKTDSKYPRKFNQIIKNPL